MKKQSWQCSSFILSEYRFRLSSVLLVTRSIVSVLNKSCQPLEAVLSNQNMTQVVASNEQYTRNFSTGRGGRICSLNVCVLICNIQRTV